MVPPVLSVLSFAFLGAKQAAAQDVRLPNFLGSDNVVALIHQIAGFALAVFVPLAALMILYAGFLFLTSGGDPTKIKTAKDTLTWAVIGIVVIILARGLVSLIGDLLGISL